MDAKETQVPLRSKGSTAHILLLITESYWEVFMEGIVFTNFMKRNICVWSKYVGRHGGLNEITLREIITLRAEPIIYKIRS